MKKLKNLLLLACVTASLAVPANAAGLEYSFDGADGPDYASATSIEVIHTANGGARANVDISKNAALIPPAFGSASMDALNTGMYLTPNLAPGGMAVGTVNGSNAIVYPPIYSGNIIIPGSSAVISSGYTEVTDDLYYSAGHLGTLKIPELGRSVRIYQGTGSSTLAKGVGHFTETSIWDGNVALAAHNRGANDYFGEIHTLDLGDTVKLTTKVGTRNYEVYSVAKISSSDLTVLNDSSENIITLITCVMNEPDYRWCVQAKAV